MRHLVMALLAAVRGTAAAPRSCGDRIDIRFAPVRPRLCRSVERSSCGFFFIVLNGVPRPCGAFGARGACVAGPSKECQADTPKLAPIPGPQAQQAIRRAHRFLRRTVAKKMGQPCASTISGDLGVADCEDWCDGSNSSSGSIAPCKYCKCRACRRCYARALPAWATSTLKGVRAACNLFGLGVCNATGNLTAVTRQIEAEAYARWQYNHTHLWIDALFATTYRRESAQYAALAPSLPRMVAAEEGLGEEELKVLHEHGEGAPTGRVDGVFRHDSA